MSGRLVGTLCRALTLLTLSACGATSAQDHSEAIAARHGIVKDVVVRYLDLRSREPALKEDGELYSSIMATIWLLDTWNDDASMSALADLSSYYLGAHGGEVLSCVVARKGSSIRPLLKKVSEDPQGDCHKNLGRESPICLQNGARRDNLAALIHRVESGGACEMDL